MFMSLIDATGASKVTDGDESASNFTANLNLASSYHSSISSLCRKMNINRQQFMKYLSGKSFPSRNSLRRICDFLGVDEFELLMPPDQFRTIISLRPAEETALPPVLDAIPARLSQSRRQRGLLIKTRGYYYEYYLSFSTPGHVLRALVHVYPFADYTLYKRVERLRRDGKSGPPDVYKYEGIMTVVGDRIYMFDQEAITGAELSQTILYTNYRNRVSSLSGLRLGVSGADAHEPSASRIYMEYLGPSVSKREALSECQLYRIDSPEVPHKIREILTAGGRISTPLRGAIV